MNLYKDLAGEKKEFILSKQILRSGTSIGANLKESECAISKKEFLSKKYIALKECVETKYWLDLLYGIEFMTKQVYQGLMEDRQALRKMLSAATKTLKNNIGTGD